MSNRNGRHKPQPTHKQNKLLIGICLYEWMPSSFFEHFLSLQNLATCPIAIQKGVYLPMAHNNLIHQALQLPKDSWDYLVWIEQDTLPPVDILRHMAHYTQPVVASLYFSRNQPPRPIAYEWVDMDKSVIANIHPDSMVPMLKTRGLYKVGAVPMGCTAIRRDVLEARAKTNKPWYDTTQLPPIEWVNLQGTEQEARESISGQHRFLGDDVYFCKWATEMGYDLYLNTATVCEHIGEIRVNDRLYIAWLEQQLKAGADMTPPVQQGSGFELVKEELVNV